MFMKAQIDHLTSIPGLFDSYLAFSSLLFIHRESILLLSSLLSCQGHVLDRPKKLYTHSHKHPLGCVPLLKGPSHQLSCESVILHPDAFTWSRSILPG